MIKNNDIQHISALFHRSPLFSGIVKKLEQLDQIKLILSNLLPEDLAKNCTLANFAAGKLIIVTNNPIWKYKLNFLKMDLLVKLRKSTPLLAGISSIAIVVDYLQDDLNKLIK